MALLTKKEVLRHSMMLLLLLLLWWALDVSYHQLLERTYRTRVSAHLTTHGTALQNALHSRIVLLEGIRAHILVDTSAVRLDRELPKYMSGLFGSAPGLRLIMVMPGGVVRWVHPQRWEELTHAYNILADEREWVSRDVQRSLRTSRVVLSDPHRLDTVGLVVSARLPIRVDTTLWGFVGITFDVSDLLKEAELFGGREHGLEILLRDRGGQTFYGDERVLEHNPVESILQLPGGQWTLSGIPRGGWTARTELTSVIFRGATLIVVLLVLLTSVMVSRRQAALEAAVKARTREISDANDTLRSEIDVRHHAEQQLQEALTTLSTIVDSSPLAIVVLEDDGSVRLWNRAAEAMFGWSHAEITGKEFPALPAESDELLHEQFARLRRGEGPVYVELQAVRKDGTTFEISRSSALLRDAGGGVDAMLFIMADISARRGAERELHHRTTFIATVLEHLPVGLSIFDPADGDLRFHNRRFAIDFITGSLPASAQDLFSGRVQDGDVRARLLRALVNDAGGHAVQLENVRVDLGDAGTRLMSFRTIPLQEQGTVILTVIDVTEQREAEDAVRRLSRAVEQSPSSIVICDLVGRTAYVNPKFTEVSGYEADEVIGHADRTIASREMSDEDFAALWDTVAGGGEWSGEFPNRRKNGDLFWEAASISPIRDSQGVISAYLAVKTDITEKKAAEQELIAAKEHAEESDRLKNAFIATMSHEIRTPLNIILGFVQLLQNMKVLDTKALEDHFASIERAGHRLMRTVEELLHISALQAGTFNTDMAVYKLDEIVEQMVHDLRKLAEGKALELEMQIEARNATVRIDRYTIEQALNNLVDNAIKYTHEGEITVGLTEGEEGWLLSVRDTGIGISDAYLERVFDVFSQENTGYSRPYDGLGLGLSLTRKYVELNGGYVRAESVKGSGSTFTIVLPRYEPHT